MSGLFATEPIFVATVVIGYGLLAGLRSPHVLKDDNSESATSPCNRRAFRNYTRPVSECRHAIYENLAWFWRKNSLKGRRWFERKYSGSQECNLQLVIPASFRQRSPDQGNRERAIGEIGDFRKEGARLRDCRAPTVAMAGKPVNLFAATASKPARHCALHLAPRRSG
jgi:hypothetical protein